MRIEVDLQPYALRVYRNAQLICADQPGRNLVYRPGEHGIANIKSMPENAVYCGFGEKAGRAAAEERQQHDQLQLR